MTPYRLLVAVAVLCLHAACVVGAWLAFSAPAFAESQTYKGLMIPNGRAASVPITITIERVGAKLKGRVTSPPPFGGEGVFLADIRNIHQCEFSTDIGIGRKLAFDGFCLANTIEGNYTLRFADGSVRSGYLHVKREEAVKRPPEKGPADLAAQPLFTTSACLSANSACLSACPHGDYNAEFVCSNRCRQKLVACKAKAASASAP